MVKGPTGADGKFVAKPYTPVSMNGMLLTQSYPNSLFNALSFGSLEQKGSFELVIKTYPNGIVSNHVCNMKEGDHIEVKGPMQKFKYVANSKRAIGMIAGGTGITPMLQVIREIIRNPADKTEVHLIFSNHAEEDILLRKEIDEIASKHKNIHVTYLVTQPSSAWKGLTGRITQSLLQQLLPAPAADVSVYVCGPPSFMESVSGGKTKDFKQGEVSGFLKELRYNEDMVFKF